MKIEKKSESFNILWLPAGTDHKNLAIWNFILFFEIGRILGHFFSMENPLYRLKSYSFFRLKFGEFLPQKKTTGYLQYIFLSKFF